jgi:phosphoglucosamine mutase
MSSVERELGRRGRLLVRYSGTENIARVMVEGEDGDRVNALAESIAGVFRQAHSRGGHGAR